MLARCIAMEEEEEEGEEVVVVVTGHSSGCVTGRERRG
jgi:hypothetical protein